MRLVKAMEKQKTEKVVFANRGVWCGKVVEEPVLDHEIRDKETNELIEQYFEVKLEVEYENPKKTIKNTSTLLVLISKTKIDALGGVGVGNLLFVKGEYRAYDRRNEETGRRNTITRIQAKKVEKVTEYTRTRNKIEFYGVLKSKLYKAKFNEEGVIELDEKGKPVPVLDENGNKISWVRRNTEGLTVNDFVLEVGKKITTEDGQEKVVYTDYIPMLAYGAIAWQVAKDIELDTPVLAQGYVRCRPKNGFADEVVYEPVITRITPLGQEKEKEQE